MKSEVDFTSRTHYEEYLEAYYAGRAMQGLLATPHNHEDHLTVEQLAELAVHQAKALIEELSK